ncbi:MAG: ROK family protein [Victivallaceae bacterium]|nr:ROK family protein [Victivallaceae bacterium]
MSCETRKTSRCDSVVLAIDAGGTYLKSALIYSCGTMVPGSFAQVEAHAQGTVEDIVAAYTGLIVRASEQAAQAGLRLAGIGIATPGPFDYRHGVSLMQHKFAALYEVNLAERLRAASHAVTGIPIRFRHDANSFLAGELWRGAARGYTRAGGITLGTGLGAACCLDGRFVNNKLGSPAPKSSLWNNPYRDGIVEDYVSSRALVAAYRAIDPDYDSAGGAKGIADAAKQGDSAAVAVYAGFGSDLGKILTPWCERFDLQIIVFGGQISRDFALFAPALGEQLQPTGGQPELRSGSLGAEAALYGAALEIC